MTYQDDAFAKMMNGSGSEDVSARLERPIVVIWGDFFELKVVDTVGSKNVREASFGVADCWMRSGSRDCCGAGNVVVVDGKDSLLEFRYSLKNFSLDSLQLRQCCLHALCEMRVCELWLMDHFEFVACQVVWPVGFVGCVLRWTNRIWASSSPQLRDPWSGQGTGSGWEFLFLFF